MNSAVPESPWLGTLPIDWQRSRIRNVATLSPTYSGTGPESQEPCTVVPMELLSADGTIDVTNQQPFAEIPEHWDVCRIKQVLSQVDYGISERSEPEGKFPVLKMANIQSGEVVFSKMEFVEEVCDGLLLEKGDLLYNRTNSPDQVGKAAVFRGAKADGITFASYLVRLRANHRADPYFLNYLLNSSGFLGFARKLAIPSVQQSNLNSTRYCRTLIPLPPRMEQEVIREYLDAKVGEIRKVVSAINEQIATLTAYRKSLIHECVTGQRRVTEEDVRRAAQSVCRGGSETPCRKGSGAVSLTCK